MNSSWPLGVSLYKSQQVELQKMIDTYMTLFLVGASNMNATSVAEVPWFIWWGLCLRAEIEIGGFVYGCFQK